MCGARPLYLSCGFILEEGFPVADLQRIVASMAAAAQRRRGADRHRRHEGRRARQGRRLLHHDGRGRAAGAADHAVGRGGAPGRRRAGVRPDRRPRHHGDAGPRRAGHLRRHRLRHRAAARASPPRCSTRPATGVRLLRDATRGGVATICNEVAVASQVAVVLDESARAGAAGGERGVGAARDRPAVRGVRGPAGRGRRAGAGRRARWPRCGRTRSARARRGSGRSSDDPPGLVLLRTSFGGTRIVDLLVGDPLPRIC